MSEIPPGSSQLETLEEVRLSDLIIKNVRQHVNEESIKRLAESIRHNGLLVPLDVRRWNGKLYLVDGGTRAGALQLLGRCTAQARVKEGEFVVADMPSTQMIINNEREEIGLVDCVQAVAALKKEGWTSKRIAEKHGWSETRVSHLADMFTWPKPLLSLVATGELPMTTAAEIVKLPAAEQPAAIELARSGQLSRDRLVGQRKQRTYRKEEKSQTVSKVTVPLGENRSVTVSAEDLDLEKTIELLHGLLEQARRFRTKGYTLKTFVQALRDTTM